MEKDSVMHKKYIPTAAITALIQILMPIFLFKNSPINGTMMMYSVVINPAFPTVVCPMPNC